MENNIYLILNEFLDDLYYQKGSSKNTYNAYKRDIKDFLKYIEECSVDYNKIEKELVFEYIQKLKSKYRQNTVARKMCAIKNFFIFLYLEKYISTDYSLYIKNIGKEKRIPEILKIEDLKKILNSYNNSFDDKQIRLILSIIIATGARVSEIVNLKVKDITDTDYEYIRVFGKGSKYRLIPIYDKLKEEIKNYITLDREKEIISKNIRNDNLFLNIRREKVYVSLKEHSKRVGIEKKVYPHLIRHTIATEMLKNGADIRIVQEILGHSNISTTEIYTHLEKSELKKMHSKIDFGGLDD